MKTLYLLRHANAANATLPQMSDFDRTLSALGVREARAVGRFMKSNRMQPDFILSSSAIRTAQTAQIVMETLQAKVANNFDKELYQAPDEKILSEIQKTDRAQRSLLVVGHNPGIAELAYVLGKIPHYAPATLSIFTADCDWSEFSPGKVKLEKVFVPEG
jgi:phosphohistidine phosphatase